MWRTETAAGLQLDGSPTELVIQTERPELEANLSVLSADDTATRFANAGGTIHAAPFEIGIGRCAVLRDPWGNRLVVLDHSKGRLVTDATRSVRRAPDGTARTQQDG